MEQEAGAPGLEGTGFPELNALGRRLEVLRIQRGVSKQHLARFAGTSRQQLWRVMTGKSELTTSLRERLAQALGVASGALIETAEGSVPAFGASPSAVGGASTAAGTGASPTAFAGLADYLADPAGVRLTIATLPGGAEGLRLKRQLLNALEDLAIERSLPLPDSFFDARRQVLAGEL